MWAMIDELGIDWKYGRVSVSTNQAHVERMNQTVNMRMIWFLTFRGKRRIEEWMLKGVCENINATRNRMT